MSERAVRYARAGGSRRRWLLGALGTPLLSLNAPLAQAAAVLAGVNFFNPDGSPYIGEWQLVSANGYDYPEIFLQASSGVSAPAPMVLVAAGLLGLAMRSRRRAEEAGI